LQFQPSMLFLKFAEDQFAITSVSILCANLSVLCVSAVTASYKHSTAETQSTLRFTQRVERKTTERYSANLRNRRLVEGSGILACRYHRLQSGGASISASSEKKNGRS